MQRNPRELARTTDPDTSHAAARTISTSSQCWQLLRAHYINARMARLHPDEPGLTDYEAAQACRLITPGRCWWHGNPIHRPGPNGRNLRVSVISDLGWQVFRAGTARRGA